MGALREKMIEEIRLRNFSPRTEQSYVAAMVGLVKHYHRSPDQLTQDEIRSSVAPQRAGPLTEFAQRGDLGNEVLLPPDFGLGRTKAVFATAKRELAIAGGVKSEGSRALALRPPQASRSLLADDGLCHGLRVRELVRLKVSYVDSEQMMVKVEQGKERKDRAILSQRLLSELRSKPQSNTITLA